MTLTFGTNSVIGLTVISEADIC